MIEDVLLVKHYPIVVWLMIAVSSKQMVLQEKQIQWLLSLIHYLCDIPYCDYYPKIENNVSKIKDLLPKLKKEEKDLIYSILIRAGYGGMKGDMEMLKNSAYLWCNRFLDNKKTLVKLFSKTFNKNKFFLSSFRKERLDFRSN